MGCTIVVVWHSVGRMPRLPDDVSLWKVKEGPGAEEEVRVEREEHRQGPRLACWAVKRLQVADTGTLSSSALGYQGEVTHHLQPLGASAEAELGRLAAELLDDGREALGKWVKGVAEDPGQRLGHQGLRSHHQLWLPLQQTDGRLMAFPASAPLVWPSHSSSKVSQRHMTRSLDHTGPKGQNRLLPAQNVSCRFTQGLRHPPPCPASAASSGSTGYRAAPASRHKTPGAVSGTLVRTPSGRVPRHKGRQPGCRPSAAFGPALLRT